MPPWTELGVQERADSTVVPYDIPLPTTLRALQQLNDLERGKGTNLNLEILPDLFIDETTAAIERPSLDFSPTPSASDKLGVSYRADGTRVEKLLFNGHPQTRDTAPNGDVTTETLIETNSETDTLLTVHKNPSRSGENVLNTNLIIVQSNGGVVVYEPAGEGKIDVMAVDKDGDIGRYLIVGNIEDIRMELEQQDRFSVNWGKDQGGNALFHFENYQRFNLRRR